MRDDLHRALGDRYAVEGELGRGGMATVWLARDRRHDRLVALKILHPELGGAIGTDRFLREIRVTARLQHPLVVPLLDSGVISLAGGTEVPWYAMAYVEGESLRARITRERQLPVDEALAIAHDVAEALGAAHRMGVVHRDVKPENVLLADGRAYVCDFGIARALADTGGERLTSTGFTVGTPTYMSPEQAAAMPVDARSDQYSLASMVYEMLAGEPPFTGPTAQAIVARRRAGPARPLRPVRPAVSPRLERALLRALERVPADRYPDIAAFTDALGATDEPPERAAVRRRWPIRALAAAVGMALVAAAAWTMRGRARQMAGPPGPDSTVVALYRRAQRNFELRTPAGVVASIADFSAAIARDSAYAPAWSGLARAYARGYNRRFAPPGLVRDSVLRLAVFAADRAMAADAASAETWLTQAIVRQIVDPTDAAPVMRAARRAVAIDSTNPFAWHTLAVSLADSGDMAAAVDTWRHCALVAPAYAQCLAFLGLGHYWRRAIDSAAAWADSAVSVDPTYLLGRTTMGSIAIERGDFERATAAFEAARRLSTEIEVVNAVAGLALVEARRGRRDAARALLREADSLAAAYQPVPMHTIVYTAQARALLDPRAALAALERYHPRRELHFQLHLRCDPAFDPIAHEPGFRALLVAPRPIAGC